MLPRPPVGGIGPMDPEEVANGEYFLLPIVVELLSSPLPGEWREVVVNGEWKFREGSTGQLHDLHPLTDTFIQIVLLERRRKRPRMRYPVWLHSAAERMMQVQQQQHPHPPTPPSFLFPPSPPSLPLPPFSPPLAVCHPERRGLRPRFWLNQRHRPFHTFNRAARDAWRHGRDILRNRGGKSAATALDADEKEGQRSSRSSRSNAQPQRPKQKQTQTTRPSSPHPCALPLPPSHSFTYRSWGCRQRRRPPLRS